MSQQNIPPYDPYGSKQDPNNQNAPPPAYQPQSAYSLNNSGHPPYPPPGGAYPNFAHPPYSYDQPIDPSQQKPPPYPGAGTSSAYPAPPAGYPQYNYPQQPQYQYTSAPVPGATSSMSYPTPPHPQQDTSLTSTPVPTTTTIIVQEERNRDRESARGALFAFLCCLGFFTMGIAWLFLWVPLVM